MMNTSNAIMEQLGLGLDFDLENLTLQASLKCHSGCQRNSNLPRLDMEEEIAYINLK